MPGNLAFAVFLGYQLSHSNHPSFSSGTTNLPPAGQHVPASDFHRTNKQTIYYRHRKHFAEDVIWSGVPSSGPWYRQRQVSIVVQPSAVFKIKLGAALFIPMRDELKVWQQVLILELGPGRSLISGENDNLVLDTFFFSFFRRHQI